MREELNKLKLYVHAAGKLTELSTFYKHFLHPRLTQSATQRLYLFSCRVKPARRILPLLLLDLRER